MKKRLGFFAVLLVLLAAFALWWRSTLGGGGFEGVLFVAIPIVLAIGVPIFLPRKLAIAWSLLVAVGVVILTVSISNANSTCSGDGCIGYSFFIYFIGIPVAALSAGLALVRFLSKGPEPVVQDPVE